MTEEFKIVRAERSQVRLRLAFQGPSGSGKTGTTLLVAKGMVAGLAARGKLPPHLDGVYIGVVDTERDSAKLYSHLVPFDTLVLEPPYSPSRYLAALHAMERVGYPIIILDQITHEWFGPGGVLSMVAASKVQNELARWIGPTAEHDAFIDGMLQSPAHIMATMRAKTAWVLEEKEVRGRMKTVVTQIGMQAKQREGTEYEFTAAFDLAKPTNAATCLKTRIELFTVGETVARDLSYPPSEPSLGMGPTWGERLIEWVYSAKALDAVAPEPSPAMRATATCEAGIRAMERCQNAPDLAKAFQDAQKAVKAHNVTAGADVVVPLLERLVATKDQRKIAVSAVPDNPEAPEGELISADDVANLEMMCMDARYPLADLRARLGVPSLSKVPLARWDEAQDLVLASWPAAFSAPARIKHTPPKAEPPAPDARAQIAEMVTRIGNGRGGMFGDMQDDTEGIV